MIEVVGNLWTFDAQVRIVTTNGAIRMDGRAVMGRGVALQVCQRYPEADIPMKLGACLSRLGNHVFDLWKPEDGPDIWTFPVKHLWQQDADLDLIERSAHELAEKASRMKRTRLVLPRPGCGNGHLHWLDVRPRLKALDSRFYVIDIG